jgi:ligand-binding sensor domain-containing protein
MRGGFTMMKSWVYFLTYVFIGLSLLFMQIPENAKAVSFVNRQGINAIAFEGDFVWLGACGGLIRLNQNTDEITCYNRFNSGIPFDLLNCIAVDKNGDKWIGTNRDYLSGGSGLIKFDGRDWTVYNTVNSRLPDNDINSIAIDSSGKKWIACGRQLVKFDGFNWTVYDSSNSGLPGAVISCLAVDQSQSLWLGFDRCGLMKFDRGDWTRFDGPDSVLPENCRKHTKSIRIDSAENKWIATADGLVKFDGDEWTRYHTGNSDLPSNGITCIAPESSGSVWVGTWYRVVKFNCEKCRVFNLNLHFAGNPVYCAKIDDAGSVWVGTRDGLFKFNGKAWVVYDIIETGLPGHLFRCMRLKKMQFN